jgi:lipopolysaccharide/colanic/teichoic acid biosynthesis glycosyltransferase
MCALAGARFLASLGMTTFTIVLSILLALLTLALRCKSATQLFYRTNMMNCQAGLFAGYLLRNYRDSSAPKNGASE